MNHFFELLRENHTLRERMKELQAENAELKKALDNYMDGGFDAARKQARAAMEKKINEG